MKIAIVILTITLVAVTAVYAAPVESETDYTELFNQWKLHSKIKFSNTEEPERKKRFAETVKRIQKNQPKDKAIDVKKLSRTVVLLWEEFDIYVRSGFKILPESIRPPTS